VEVRAQTDSVPATRAAFDSLKARLLAGDTAVDYAALRLAYTATPEYDPFAHMTDPLRERMMQAHFGAKDPEASRVAADSLLRTNYVDIDAHMIVALASAALGDSTRAHFHQIVAQGLLDSITRSGTGTTADTPYEVISIIEEYALLRGGNVKNRRSLSVAGNRATGWKSSTWRPGSRTSSTSMSRESVPFSTG
jgi:hypothetical protein